MSVIMLLRRNPLLVVFADRHIRINPFSLSLWYNNCSDPQWITFLPSTYPFELVLSYITSCFGK